MTVRLKERRCRRQEMARKPIAFNLAVEFATAGLPGQPIRLWIVVSQFAQLANTSLRIRHVHHCCAQFEGIARPNGLILKPRFVSTAMPPRCGLASRPRDNLTSGGGSALNHRFKRHDDFLPRFRWGRPTNR